MTDELADALVQLFERLGPYAQQDAALRGAVEALGRAVAAWAAGLAPAPQQQPAPEPVAQPPARPAIPRLPEPPPLPAPVRPHPEDEYERREIVPDPPAHIAKRCGLKAAICRWIARELAFGLPDFASPTAKDFRAEAEAFGMFDLWMLADNDYAIAAKVWSDLAGAYEAAGESAAVLAQLDSLPEGLASANLRPVLYLAAEAQALLFAAVADARRRNDNDQVQLYIQVRERARAAHTFIDRFLTRSDRVPPEGWPQLLQRAAQRRELLGDLVKRVKAREKDLKNLRFKLHRIADAPDSSAEEWSRVLELLDGLVASGLPPTDREVRELLLPVWDACPEELPRGQGAERVFRAVDEYLATQHDDDEAAPDDEKEPTAEVRAVAEMLRGREVVLIGGNESPPARRALERAFGLSALNWITTREHESVTVFEAPIARREVALVLLAIRWSSHSYGDVRNFCTEFGKPLVRLKAGYNPNQVAHHILNQVGERLRALAPTA